MLGSHFHESSPMKPSQPRFGLVTRLCGVVMIGVLLFFTLARPLRQAVARSQGQRLVAQATAAMQNGDWPQAAEALGQARAALPGDPNMLRALAKLLDVTQSDAHLLLHTLAELEAAGHAEEADAACRVRALTAVGRHVEARTALAKLSVTQRAEPGALLAEAALLQEEGDAAKARAAALKAQALLPGDTQAALSVAIADSWNTPYEVQSAARQRLWKLAAGQDAAAVAAVEHLAAQSDTTLPEVQRLMQLVEAHPLTRPASRLTVLSALMRRAPEQRAALLDAEMARFRGADISLIQQAAQWLAAESEHLRLLEICPWQLAMQSRELFPIFAASLARTQRWKELREMLSESSVPADREQVHVWLAWADGHLEPDTPKARLQLESAITGAKKALHAQALLAAAQVAEDHGMLDLALDCLRSAARLLPPRESHILTRARDLARHLAETRALLEITRRLAELRPSSEGFAMESRYYSLLLGETLELSSPSAATPTARERLLTALAAHRLQDTTALKTALQTLPDARDLPPGERAVLAGLLACAGEAAQAFQLAEKVPQELLLDEERHFLKMAQ